MRVRLSRIVLVGLPGAGKSTVGPLLAERLGWDFVDPDRSIEREAGLDTAAIFRTRGEAAFRELERAAVDRALRQDDVVIAPGGGWAARPGAIDSLPRATAVVWLQVSATEAARRLEQDPVERPLVSGADMAARIGKLEGERSLAYAAAGIAVETDGITPEAVADEIAARLVSEYGVDGEAQ